MHLFGLKKTPITPEEFVKAELKSLFSQQFEDQQRHQFHSLSMSHPLQRTTAEIYVKEKQNVVFNLLQIAWDRNSPDDVFIKYSLIMLNDPRVKAVNSGVYDRSLSRAQEAGMSTFGFIASIFIFQILPAENVKQSVDIARLHELYGNEFTSIYLSYEALIKNKKFMESL